MTDKEKAQLARGLLDNLESPDHRSVPDCSDDWRDSGAPNEAAYLGLDDNDFEFWE